MFNTMTAIYCENRF